MTAAVRGTSRTSQPGSPPSLTPAKPRLASSGSDPAVRQLPTQLHHPGESRLVPNVATGTCSIILVFGCIGLTLKSSNSHSGDGEFSSAVVSYLQQQLGESRGTQESVCQPEERLLG